MQITGQMLIGSQAVKGHKKAIRAMNPATNEALEPEFLGGDKQHVNQAVALAWQAEHLEGQLTVTIQMLDSDVEEVRSGCTFKERLKKTS